MSNNNFLKGSEWLKWDLHVHTPYSKGCYGKHDDQKIWDRFFEELEDSKLDVIGINDYGFIEGYKKVIEAKNNNRFRNIKLVLPVIELRINKFADLDKDINIHLVISNQKSSDYINKQIINSLKFLDNTVVQPDYIMKNLEKGREAILTNSLEDMLKANRENLIVGISYNEAVQIKSKDTFGEALKALKVDFILCATKHSDFDKRLKDIKQNDVLKSLAIINASDKHNFKEKDGHCNDFSKFSWIKANPTFAGLRLAIHSPDDRVCIRDYAPVDKTNIYKFKNIKSEVFETNKLELNEHGLISIIGNKAQGKSLLGSIIASIDGNNESFENYDFMNNVEIEFNDNEPNNIKCKWLSQNYIEEIVNPRDNKDLNKNLQNELKRIVFSHTKHAKEEEIKELNEDIKKTQDKIDKLNSSFASYNKCEYEIKSLETQKTNYENEKASHESLKNKNETITASSEYKSLNSIDEEKNKVTDKLNKVTKLNTDLKDINEQYNEYLEYIRGKNKKIKEILDGYKEISLEVDFNNININDFYFDEKLEKQKGARNILSENLEKKKEELQTEIKESEQLLKEKKDDLEKTKDCDLQKVKDIYKIEKNIRAAEENILTAETNKKKKEEELEEIKINKKNHKQNFIKLFELFSKRKNTYMEIQKNIDKSIECLTSNTHEHNELYLNDVAHELKEVAFEVKYDSEFIAKYTSNVLDCLNNNKVNANDIGKEFKACSDKLLNSECIENDAENLYNIIIKYFLDKDINQKLRKDFKGESDNDYDKTYLNKVFKIDLRVSYEILYKNKEIKKLSAGERGTALLLLYLLLDKEYEQYPLVIDQPEDNIDNQTINKTLVPALKVAKQKRQIFLITHNPNLVVNTDSEQVIVAKADQENKYLYQCGSLETPEIVDRICQILEGGKEAFQKRYQNYYLQDSKMFNNKKF